MKCPWCNATYTYSGEVVADGTVKCQNCGRTIRTTGDVLVRCPVCFSENVTVEGNRILCAECGPGSETEAEEGTWHRVNDFRVDLLSKYLELWPDYWNKVKGWSYAGTRVSIRDKSEITVGRCRIISIPVTVYVTAVFVIDIEQSRCWVTIQSWHRSWIEMMEKLVESFMMAVAACNDVGSTAAGRQALEQP